MPSSPPVALEIARTLSTLETDGSPAVPETVLEDVVAEMLPAATAAAFTAAPAGTVTELVEAATRQVFAPDPLADPAAELAESPPVPEEAATRADVEVRLVDTHLDVAAAVGVLDAVFAPGAGHHFYPPSLLRNLLAAGAPVLVAWDGTTPVGVVLALPGWNADGRPQLQSGPMAVLPAARGRGVSVALKLGQRAWALDRDIAEIRWTFDAMVAVNARLNLRRLGAVVEAFLPGYEGVRDAEGGTPLPHDRLLVSWSLPEPAGPGEGVPHDVGWAVTAGHEGLPEVHAGWERQPATRVAVPPHIAALRRDAPAAASAWQQAVGQVLQAAVTGGWRVGWHPGGGYLLTAPTRPLLAPGEVGHRSGTATATS